MNAIGNEGTHFGQILPPPGELDFHKRAANALEEGVGIESGVIGTNGGEGRFELGAAQGSTGAIHGIESPTAAAGEIDATLVLEFDVEQDDDDQNRDADQWVGKEELDQVIDDPTVAATTTTSAPSTMTSTATTVITFTAAGAGIDHCGEKKQCESKEDGSRESDAPQKSSGASGARASISQAVRAGISTSVLHGMVPGRAPQAGRLKGAVPKLFC